MYESNQHDFVISNMVLYVVVGLMRRLCIGYTTLCHGIMRKILILLFDFG
jgi:hypothetical protein